MKKDLEKNCRADSDANESLTNQERRSSMEDLHKEAPHNKPIFNFYNKESKFFVQKVRIREKNASMLQSAPRCRISKPPYQDSRYG